MPCLLKNKIQCFFELTVEFHHFIDDLTVGACGVLLPVTPHPSAACCGRTPGKIRNRTYTATYARIPGMQYQEGIRISYKTSRPRL